MDARRQPCHDSDHLRDLAGGLMGRTGQPVTPVMLGVPWRADQPGVGLEGFEALSFVNNPLASYCSNH